MWLKVQEKGRTKIFVTVVTQYVGVRRGNLRVLDARGWCYHVTGQFGWRALCRTIRRESGRLGPFASCFWRRWRRFRSAARRRNLRFTPRSTALKVALTDYHLTRVWSWERMGALWNDLRGRHRHAGHCLLLEPSTGGSWRKAVLHNFSGADGSLPATNLVFNKTGALCGTTLEGGTGNNGGTVFELTPPSVAGGAWTEAVLYSLAGGCGGQRYPYGAVAVSSTGTLYGTASRDACLPGGIATGRAVFGLTPPAASGGDWTEHTLLNLDKDPLGTYPLAGVVSTGGPLYGTAYFSGGLYGQACGPVYEVSPPGHPRRAWSGAAILTFSRGDGCGSQAALTVGPGGVLYGTTTYGGSGAGSFGRWLFSRVRHSLRTDTADGLGAELGRRL
jgi:hypothetical protein